MKKNTLLKLIILLLIILFFCLLCFSFYLIYSLRDESDNKKAVINDERPQNVQQAIAEFDIEYLKEEDNKIYVNFAKDLYDNNEKSNETYFNNIIDALEKFFENKDFYMIDESKNIEIYVQYEDNSYITSINGMKNFFKEVDSKTYINIINASLPERQRIYTSNDYLRTLTAGSMSTKYINKILGEGEEIENNYVSYNDGAILVRTTLAKTVRNIIFTYKYQDDVVKNVNLKTSLKEILDLYPDKAFGSLNEEYLGYCSDNFYYFFYDDEISVYGITYTPDEKFEEYLTNYLNDNDLDKFVNSIKSSMITYDYLEYDPEIGKAHIMFSHKGIEINIEENNPKGIMLYSNYYLTDVTKDYIQRELITFKAKENSVEKIEKERRRNR